MTCHVLEDVLRDITTGVPGHTICDIVDHAAGRQQYFYIVTDESAVIGTTTSALFCIII